MNAVDVGAVDEIPVGEGRTYVVHGEQIAVFRLRDGTLRAVDAVCPHRGGPLADGLADGIVVVCPLHGHTFNLCTGDEAGGADLSVRSHRAEIVDGRITIVLSEHPSIVI
ncbi:(2Fe-2S)-binding protein [Mycobacterium sp. 852013-51886_SCH5428379]|uniref:Rieske (2Fe-2S) protein n=1 Tax=Mycobacterium sp. 852013-51886_SCH5428379 TaxID=1834111 RepID=UPI0007FF6F82|nr:Rieske 2Fe-2S domain-containing protein [Mycobacterium sp. 852013-51886_SCH5428379]OBB60264.1 (2Fe-2S)-binding protein [Mycobacterium sp. 852013-51886_SCH5428379]